MDTKWSWCANFFFECMCIYELTGKTANPLSFPLFEIIEKSIRLSELYPVRVEMNLKSYVGGSQQPPCRRLNVAVTMGTSW